MKNFNQIMYFTKVAELASFSKAAKALGITPTAISKQIKGLEAELGESLFLRTTRSVRLTEFGERLHERSSRLRAEMGALEHFLKSKRDEPEGALTVLASNMLAKDFVLAHLREYTDSYPKVRLEVIFDEGDQLFEDQAIDVMVGYPELGVSKDALKYRKLFDCHNILIASPDYIERHGLPLVPADLLDAKFITHSLRKPGNLLPLKDGRTLPISLPILYLNSFDALNQACLDGIGIFLTGNTLVRDELASGELIEVMPDIDFRHYEIFIFYRAYDYEIPKIRTFVEFYDAKNKKSAW